MNTDLGAKYSALNTAITQNAVFFLQKWLPGGVVKGAKFLASDLGGAKGESLNVNIDTGQFYDHADPSTRGGDFISLYAAINNLQQKQAYDILNSELGGGSFPPRRVTGPSSAPSTSRPAKTKPKFKRETPTEPINKNLMFSREHGNPVSVYEYKNRKGITITHVARYQTSSGGKSYRPFSFQDGKWKIKALPEKRPLYYGDKLHGPKKQIIIVEGEKCADHFNNHIADKRLLAISWQGGVAAIKKTDWNPLRDRKVIIWPDNDNAGIDCGQELAKLLNPICNSVKVLDVARSTLDIPKKWDAADSNFDTNSFIEWAKPIATTYTETVVQPEISLPVMEIVSEEAIETIEFPDQDRHSTLMSWGIPVSARGAVTPNSTVALAIIKNYKNLSERIWFDTFSNKIIIDWFDSPGPTPMINPHYTLIAEVAHAELGISKMNTRDIKLAVELHGMTHKRDHIVEQLESLVWDKTPRITSFLTEYFGCEETSVIGEISQKWLISMVARMMCTDPEGVKVDWALVLESGQGFKKSAALRALAGGTKYFTEAGQDFGDREFLTKMNGRIIVELCELDGMTRRTQELVKKIMTTQVDVQRVLYTSGDEMSHPRRSVFVGTTNKTDYLTDVENRRFIGVAITKIDVDGIISIRNQLFAEALHNLKQGANWWEFVCQDEITERANDRREEDGWEVPVLTFIEGGYKSILSQNEEFYMTVENIARYALDIPISNISKKTRNRISDILRGNGYVRKQVRVGRIRVRTWK